MMKCPGKFRYKLRHSVNARSWRHTDMSTMVNPWVCGGRGKGERGRGMEDGGRGKEEGGRGKVRRKGPRLRIQNTPCNWVWGKNITTTYMTCLFSKGINLYLFPKTHKPHTFPVWNRHYTSYLWLAFWKFLICRKRPEASLRLFSSVLKEPQMLLSQYGFMTKV